MMKKSSNTVLTSNDIHKKKQDMENVIKDIVLPFLPAKTLVRFRAVSKEWDQRIRSPFLAFQQSYHFQNLSGYFCQYTDSSDPTFVTLNNSAYGVPTPSLRFLPELVNIVSSCNGLLLCQSQYGNNSYYICNPANKEWRELPQPGLYHGSKPATLLAFEPSALNIAADYQLISAVPMIDQPVILFELYSSQTKSWRISDATFFELGDSSFINNGFYMKGIAYWETTARKVVAFDLKTEIYEIISLPSETPPGGVLTQINGELSYIGMSHFLDDKYSIKIYGGMDLSLKHVMNVNLEPGLNPVPRYRVLPCLDGEVVMILMGSFIYSYSMKDRRIEGITRAAIEYSGADKYVPYVNSLVHVA